MPVWAQGIEGQGVTVSIVDDGVDSTHEDLAGGVVFEDSNGLGPRRTGFGPRLGGSAVHGTAVAGVVAARADNGRGGRGVAPGARIIANDVTLHLGPHQLVDAMTRDLDSVDIVNVSWGASDMTGRLVSAMPGWSDAIERGLAEGRSGRGTIYVWSSGNGGSGDVDDSNYDGYANHPGVIAVGAVGRDGKRCAFSERGANILVSAPSMGRDGAGITTTDVEGLGGINDGRQRSDYPDLGYTNSFTGTSAATPMVTGVVALMLSASPLLTWRDVRVILARTARVNDPEDMGWTVNAAGLAVHDAHGFGVVDAHAAVDLARQWVSVGPGLTWHSELTPIPVPAVRDQTAPAGKILVRDSGITRLESVEVSIHAPAHEDFGPLEVILVSPGGTVSTLARPHPCSRTCGRIDGWTFSSVRHMDEPADGQWTLEVRDTDHGALDGLQTWDLRLFGRST
ncbi:MAG: S8 family serine peptidase [Deltaproteobacteria bacterium]|nr:S8 family serine peptidase [Deltaproteobacteria bacterium]